MSEPVRLDRCPTCRAADQDLFAHFNTRTADPEVARDLVLRTVDLGWRPVVGSHDLWTPGGRHE